MQVREPGTELLHDFSEEMLEEFEQRLAELLEQQQAMAEFLPTPPEQSNQPT